MSDELTVNAVLREGAGGDAWRSLERRIVVTARHVLRWRHADPDGQGWIDLAIAEAVAWTRDEAIGARRWQPGGNSLVTSAVDRAKWRLANHRRSLSYLRGRTPPTDPTVDVDELADANVDVDAVVSGAFDARTLVDGIDTGDLGLLVEWLDGTSIVALADSHDMSYSALRCRLWRLRRQLDDRLHVQHAASR
jgi:hypothetical protein